MIAILILKDIRGCAKDLDGAAEKFQTGKVTTTFISRVTEIAPTQGDILEVATMKIDEVFRKEDSRAILGIDLGANEVEIRAPVTFRYHIRLTDTWRLATRGNVCLVQAPAIRPTQPPAIHTDQMEKRTERGWGRFSAEELLQNLEASMTPNLVARAQDGEHTKLVREACRLAVAKFVRTWLLKENQWRDDRLTAIIVVFADERTFSSDEQLAGYQSEPALRLAEDGPKELHSQASQP